MDKFKELWNIVKKLRNKNGCPWDRAQDEKTLLPNLIEEVYEVARALEGEDTEGLKDELGDLLFMIFSYLQIAEEKKQFSHRNVVDKIKKKMIERHPHVFGKKNLKTPLDVVNHWHNIKDKKRKEKNISILDNIPANISSIARASLIQERTSRVGFDWNDALAAFEKIKEEIHEIEDRIAKNETKENISGEIGDLLFAVTNVARLLKIDSEVSLHSTNEKFISRFKYIERRARDDNKPLHELPLDEMEKLWQESKNCSH